MPRTTYNPYSREYTAFKEEFAHFILNAVDYQHFLDLTKIFVDANFHNIKNVHKLDRRLTPNKATNLLRNIYSENMNEIRVHQHTVNGCDLCFQKCEHSPGQHCCECILEINHYVCRICRNRIACNSVVIGIIEEKIFPTTDDDDDKSHTPTSSDLLDNEEQYGYDHNPALSSDLFGDDYDDIETDVFEPPSDPLYDDDYPPPSPPPSLLLSNLATITTTTMLNAISKAAPIVIDD